MKVWLSRNAKRFAALTLALVLVLALAACGSKTQTPETSSTPTVVTPPVQTPADPTSDPARPAGTETASTMTQSEIKSAVVAWLSDKGNDAQVSFSQQMNLIDTTCQALMGSGARDLLDSAGCQNVKGDWPVQASDRVEAILEAVGLRG